MTSPHPNPRLAAADSTVNPDQRIPRRTEYVTVFLEHWATLAAVHALILAVLAISLATSGMSCWHICGMDGGVAIALVGGIFSAAHENAVWIELWREINLIWYATMALVLGFRYLGVYLSNANVVAAIAALGTSQVFYGLIHFALDVYDSTIAAVVSLRSGRPISEFYFARIGHSVARRWFHWTPTPRQGGHHDEKASH
ncbi:hypothetical protein OG21DRAFT_1601832 [Imleria badia]|nr:hypothetical protein OG21DRAFT_1601832 [Imleria badia]